MAVLHILNLARDRFFAGDDNQLFLSAGDVEYSRHHPSDQGHRT